MISLNDKTINNQNNKRLILDDEVGKNVDKKFRIIKKKKKKTKKKVQ